VLEFACSPRRPVGQEAVFFPTSARAIARDHIFAGAGGWEKNGWEPKVSVFAPEFYLLHFPGSPKGPVFDVRETHPRDDSPGSKPGLTTRKRPLRLANRLGVHRLFQEPLVPRP